MTVEKLSRTPPVCHKSQVESQPPTTLYAEAFLCAPYVSGSEDGRPRPAGEITQCLWAGSAERCRLNKHAWRDRKTGPCVPLRVFYCWSHERYFTVYPMGHVPYSRKPVLPVDLGGHVVASRDEEAASGWKGGWFRSCRGRLFGPIVAARADRRGGSRQPPQPTAMDCTERLPVGNVR
jgi:hypothetical protein